VAAARPHRRGADRPLATYYTERGETPGRWVGSGLAGIDGLAVGDEVTAEQMQAAVRVRHCTRWPQQRRTASRVPDLTEKDYRAGPAGAPYKVHAGDVSAFRWRSPSASRTTLPAWGTPATTPLLSVDERARIRTQVAVEFFPPSTAAPRPTPASCPGPSPNTPGQRTTAVGGYDLTFSPVKSVSTLWAVAPPDVAAQVELAHHDAVTDALAFIEKHALYTGRAPTGCVRSTSPGWSRPRSPTATPAPGTPTCTPTSPSRTRCRPLSGKWLAIDGRILFKANVTASETYNTALEKHLRTRLGLSSRSGRAPTGASARPRGRRGRPEA
jgi:hypothetical protein